MLEDTFIVIVGYKLLYFLVDDRDMNFCNLYYDIDSEIIVDLSTTCSREISRTNRECRAGCFDQMKSLPSFEMPQKIVLKHVRVRSALPPVRE